MNREIWKTIEDYPNYQVSNLGNVKNKKTRRFLTPKIGRDGRYLSVYLCNNGKENTQRVHRLVAEAFLGKHPGMMVNHIDGNKLNNHLDNLEWCTARENNIHAVKTGLNHPGAYQKRAVRVVETGEIFDGVVECANAVGCDFRNVYRSLNHDRHYAVNGLHFEYVSDSKKPKRESFLRDYQMDAVKKMFNGCILCGGVGSGKSRTALFYYFKENGGWIDKEKYTPMENPQDLYIISTARKRDTLEWEGELANYLLYPDKKTGETKFGNKIMVDSWNNIKKYSDVRGAFFIFDEDRVTGSGAWVKAFLKIAKSNNWIILSATPGDVWSDYIPVFIANGFYRNKTEFTREHIVYSRYCNYPKIDKYVNTRRLIRLRDRILVDMDFDRKTIAHHEDVLCRYDTSKYKYVIRNRWDIYKDEPIQQASGLCYVLRRVVNSDESRQVALLEIFEKHPKMIVFYNFDYERELLLKMFGIYEDDGIFELAEWSGHAHKPVPTSNSWVYLVQYTAGAEGWNCIKTDTIVFYSQNYSYKIMQQASGRIDRLNSPFRDLYYYHLKSKSGIDLAISRALKEKKKFNERKWCRWD